MFPKQAYTPCLHALAMPVLTQLFSALATSQTAAYQAPLSMGFSRKEYESRLPFPIPGDLPDPGTEPGSVSPASADRFFTISATWEAPWQCLECYT